MFVQWGFTEKGIEVIYASNKAKYIDFDREDVITVYIEDYDKNSLKRPN